MAVNPVPEGAVVSLLEIRPHFRMEPSADSAEKDHRVEEMAVNPDSVGASELLPPYLSPPQTEIVPLGPSAAKAFCVEAIEVNPVPEGAPSPPDSTSPHAEIEPAASSAAKAWKVE